MSYKALTDGSLDLLAKNCSVIKGNCYALRKTGDPQFVLITGTVLNRNTGREIKVYNQTITLKKAKQILKRNENANQEKSH